MVVTRFWLYLLFFVCFMVSYANAQINTFITSTGNIHKYLTDSCPDGTEVSPVFNENFELETIERLNILREQYGVPPLKLSESLTLVARFHANDMCALNYFSHNSQNNSGNESCLWYDRVGAFYMYNTAGENIAAGQDSPEEVIGDWEASTEGHFENMINTSFREVGIGYADCPGSSYGNRWVQDFGMRAEVYPLIINKEARTTNTTAVSLYVYGEGLFTEMRLKNDGEAWSDWMPFDATVDWTLKNMAGLRGVETELKIGSYVITSIDYIYLDIEAVPAVELKMKAVLQGPYAANMGLMTSYLNEQQLLPLNQPYSGAPYFYNGTESVANMTVIPTNVVDWVLVQARSANNVSEVVEQKAAFLLNNGNVVDVNGATNGVQFFNLNENTDYYIGLVHRNHIAVISSAVVNLPNAMTYDFSESANKAMGNEQQVLVSGNVYALIAGDVQADGMIQYADFNAYLQGVAFNGYHNADCNLNGMVSQDDFDLWQPNTSKIGLSIVRY